MHAEVLWVDRFGNCQLNVGPEDLAAGVDVWAVSIGDERRAAKLATSFRELGPGSVGLVLDSQGMYALAFDQRSAASELHLATGDAVAARRVRRRRRSSAGGVVTGHVAPRPVACAAMRPATTLAIGLLLLAILVAGVDRAPAHLGSVPRRHGGE